MVICIRRTGRIKIWEGNTVLPKFGNVCPNHDFPELEKKICLKFRVKTKNNKCFYLEFISNFSIFVSKT